MRRFSLTAWLLAFSLLALSMMAAPARPEPVPGGVRERATTVHCIGRWGSVSCIRFRRAWIHPHIARVPQPVSEQDRADAEARDRRWVERCQPVIRQDQYGMPRYTYAAAGCEYGRLD